jgi:hypothetical protein
MEKGRMRLGGVLALALMWVVSCSSSKEECQGAERCACYANGTCNAGLECRSNLCVGSGDGSGLAGGTGVDTAACLGCAEKTCKAERDACSAASGCLDLVDCALGCGSDVSCVTTCSNGISAETGQKLVAYELCALTKCGDDCAPQPGGFGGALAGGGTGGTAPTNAGGANPGGTSAGGTSAGGTRCDEVPNGTSGSAGSVTVDPNDGVDWLTLVGDAAPSDVSDNGMLGIEGVFYAYGDACATTSMQWDPDTRCLSGELCLADELGENWGVAIGFDLDNREEVKHAWNATTAGVKGFAWLVDGAPRGLQFWVQNMDPSFSGTCSAMTCSIDGPPDGTSAASASGQLTFGAMQKDFWGGTGVAYDFDPANISSLQFKLPAALDSFSASYTICIDALGVLR